MSEQGRPDLGRRIELSKAADARVTLVEKNPGFGGTSTFGGVNCWEPGVGGNGVHFEIAERLMRQDEGFVGVYCGPGASREKPWARSRRCGQPYEATLARAGRHILYRFHFEPAAMDRVMHEMLLEADSGEQLQILLESAVTDLEVLDRNITTVTVQTPSGKRVFAPKLVLDCSADTLRPEWAAAALCGGGGCVFPVWRTFGAAKSTMYFKRNDAGFSCHACG